MKKKNTRWSNLKIFLGTLACALIAPGLFWLGSYVDAALETASRDPSSPTPALRPSSLLTMLGVAGVLLSLLGVIWLIARIRDARTPAWEKRGKKKRRR